MIRALVYILAIFCLISTATQADSEIKRIDKIHRGNVITRHFLYNPVGFWKFDEVSGSTAIDNSGQGNHGTINGATRATGKIGQALSLDGMNGYVDAGSATVLDNIDIKTVSAWIKLNSFGEGSAGRIIDKDDGNNDGWFFFVNNTASANLQSVAYFDSFGAGPGIWSSPTNSILTGGWYHVVMVYNRTSYTNDPLFYINGSIVITTENTTPPSSAADNDSLRSVFVGNRSATADRTFNGIIDDVRIYKRALTADEVKRLYFLGQQ